MPSPNSVFSELVISTFRNTGTKPIDNFSKHNALMRELSKKGKMRMESGGLTITHPLEYTQNSTYQRYSGYDTLNIQASEVFTGVEYPWRQAAVHVSASGQEIRTNSGKDAIFKLVSSRIKNAMRTFYNNMSSDIYSNGSLTNQVGGLQLLAADSGIGTVGGIDASAFPFWKNIVQSYGTPLQGGGAVTPGPTTVEFMMLNLWLALTRNADTPNLIVADNNYYSHFDASQTSLKRYVDGEDAKAGFENLAYKSAKVMFDGNGGCPANHMYFLNTDYLQFVSHSDADMTPLPQKMSVNQDAEVNPIIWMGNLICTNRSLQGVLKA